MVVHWLRLRGPHWLLKILLNGLGTVATAASVLIIAYNKFLDGAWIVLLLLPMLVLGFKRIHRHYQHMAAELTLRGLPPSLRPFPRPRIVLPVSSVHRGVIKALRYASAISDDVTSVHVEIQPGSGQRVQQLWDEWGLEELAHLVIVPSPYRSLIGPFLAYLDQTDHEHNDDQLASIILPEFVPAHGWEAFLHNQTALLVRVALLYRRRNYQHTRAIIDIPWYLRD
jgi:hypothetical protein